MGYSIVEWVTKTKITLVKLLQLNTNIDVLRGYAGIARRVAAQSITNDSLDPIELDHSYVDEANFFNISGAPTEIAIPYKGRYGIEIAVKFVANGTGIRGVELYLNGSLDDDCYVNAVAGGVKGTTVKFYFETAQRQAGNIYTFKAYQNSGGPLDMQARVSIRCLLNET